MSHKKKLLFGVAAVVLFCAVGCLAFFRFGEQRLSESEIGELREKYPVCGNFAYIPQNIDLFPPKWSRVLKRTETFLYGTIEGEPTFYRRDSFYEDEWYEYPICVIEDTSGLYFPGEKLTITAIGFLIDYNPHFSPGDRVVVAVSADEEKHFRTYFDVVGTYYVTENDYVLSAFDEEALPDMEKTFTGEKVDVLLKELKQALRERPAVAPQAEREDGEQFS